MSSDPGGARSVPDAARAVLSRMRAASRAAPTAAAGGASGSSRPGQSRVRPRRAAAGFSGPGADERDPQTLAGAWGRLVADRGWTESLDVARLHGMWDQIVGPTNAEHASPEEFDPRSGVLTVRTTSTAWAEQLRLMLPAVRAAVDAHVGPGVVRDIRIVGPAPPRTRGRLRVKGRGPRDTYG